MPQPRIKATGFSRPVVVVGENRQVHTASSMASARTGPGSKPPTTKGAWRSVASDPRAWLRFSFKPSLGLPGSGHSAPRCRIEPFPSAQAENRLAPIRTVLAPLVGLGTAWGAASVLSGAQGIYRQERTQRSCNQRG